MSLKARVTLMALGIICATIVTVSAVAYYEQRESLRRNLDLALSSVASNVRAHLGELPALDRPVGDPSAAQAFAPVQGIRLIAWREQPREVIYTSAGTPQAAGAWIDQLDVAQAPQGGATVFLNIRHGDHPYRAAWLREPEAGGVVCALVATPSSYAQHEMDEFLRVLVILGTGMLAAAAVLTTLSVWWAMRVVGQTADRLEGVTHRNLGPEHLDGVSAPREIAPFVESVRAMLGRLREGVRAQDRFIADASHELRTPLALAKSTIQAARLKPRTAQEYQRILDELLADVDRLGRLTGQLLDLARLEESDDAQAVEAVAIAPLLDRLVERYAPAARAGGGSIVSQMDGYQPVVRGHSVELESLLGNLIDNAIKHGPPGGCVRIGAGPCKLGVRVTVHDEGGGIPPEQAGRLFDRFGRADGSRSRATGGAGLGLAIARDIARRHGGDITVSSPAGEGTSFVVELPVVHPSA
jgi:signal transduction histidine kinase